MVDEKLSFTTLKEWSMNAPDVGKELFPKPDTLVETYKDWLAKYPEGYVC